MKHLKHKTAAMTRRTFLGIGMAGASLVLAGPSVAWARQAYPSRTVSMIVPYAPGGQGDVFARLLSEPMSQALGQSIVVENRPGASGMLGTRQVVREKADGHHLLMGQTGEIAIMPIVNPSAGYDAQSELTPIVLVGDSPLVLITPKDSPYNTLEDLISHARQNPDAIAYASSGTATPGHLAGEALCLGTETKMIHVPYKGAGQAMTDVIGGQVDFFFSSASAAMGHVRSGTVKALAVSTQQRLHTQPDVPTVAETVLPGFNFSLWGGIFAPHGTDAGITLRINEIVNDILARDAIRERFVADGSAVEPNTPEQFSQFVEAEIAKYRDLVKATGVSIE